MKCMAGDGFQQEKERGTEMNRTDKRTNEILAQLVERFRYHHAGTKSDNPLVAGAAIKMCEVEMFEMWVLTQD